MKHSPLFAGLVLTISMVASACGTLAPESLAFADTASEQTTLRIATSRIVGFEAAIASWEREHPTVDVEVVLNSPEGHHEWLRTEAMDSGDGETSGGLGGDIDIIAFDGAYGADARELPNLFLDLREHGIAALEDDFLPSRWEEGIATNGNLIAVPVDVDAQVLLVRNDLVEASTIETLSTADTWCDVIQAGNDVFSNSGKAFFADGEEAFRAILSQNRSPLVTNAGRLDETIDPELNRAFDLAMLIVGERPIGTNPCPGLTNAGAIARDLTPGESIWRAEIASDDFTAVISQWSALEQISQSHPDGVRNWLALPLPNDSIADNPGTSSEGGLHFGIAADSENSAVALDFLRTITNPVVQRSTFASGQGPLPAVSSAYEDGTVAKANDGFFIGRPSVGDVWVDAVDGRPNGLADAQRRVVITAFADALARVQAGLETPQEAWNYALDEIANQSG